MKTEKALPNILPGWICQQHVRRGNKLCGPYWYRFWREDGRLRKKYVRPDHLSETVKACERWQCARREVRLHRRQAREGVVLLRGIKARLRSLGMD